MSDVRPNVEIKGTVVIPHLFNEIQRGPKDGTVPPPGIFVRRADHFDSVHAILVSKTFRTKMPLADVASTISIVMKEIGDSRKSLGYAKVGWVRRELRRIASRHQSSSRRIARRAGDIKSIQLHALSGQPVAVWHPCVWMTVDR